jgi:purine nucleosidase
VPLLLSRKPDHGQVNVLQYPDNRGIAMQFPAISDAKRLERLQAPTGKVYVVLDTDTYNEIDDQFAIVYALLSPERLDVRSIYAAPFHNKRSKGAADGMEKSYQEILRVLSRINVPPEGLVYRGSEGFLSSLEHPCRSEAALDLVRKAMQQSDEPLYVVAIGALTNVASAILLEPQIISKLVVIWLGGQPLYWPTVEDFNLKQDPIAARLIFDCGVPLVLIPCTGVASHLLSTAPELEARLGGYNAIGDYLTGIFAALLEERSAWSKEIWDASAIAYLINPEWIPTDLVHSPVLTEKLTWALDNSRHLIRIANFVHRDPIFMDMFQKIRSCR